MGRATGRGSGKRSSAVSTQKGRPYTVSIMATSKAREPWGLKISPSWEIRTSSPCSVTRHPPTLHSSSLMVRSRYRRSAGLPPRMRVSYTTVPFPSTAMRKGWRAWDR